ncbi:MAG: hypothetical protein M3O70_20055 [Actinomycetota bacterium]|nr:hypothetical protein [Actinomycetota bacterium]
MPAQFWNGADVRWVGPDHDRDGLHLGQGDRAIVVDAGRHHVSSFGALTRRRVRPSRGMVIRLSDGQELRVPARHLQLVAPDHPLRPESDAQLADWWLEQLEDWRQSLAVAAFVPRSLPAVCRLLHPWRDPSGQRVSWDDVVGVADFTDRAELAHRLIGDRLGVTDPLDVGDLNRPTKGELDHATAASLIDVFTHATTSPNDVLFAVWVGWGDIPPERFPSAARLATPGRGHFLLRGPLHGALNSVSAWPVAERPVSGIWWPADRAWLLHTEIDFPWTFITGTPELIDEVHHRGDIETMATTHDVTANLLED